jgi:CHAT domain-containing protein
MKPLFYFTYANQPDDFLANLKLESNYISEVFAELVAENVFDLIKDESSYTDNVLQVLLTEAYRLEFFHYAGHAGTGTLVFGDNPLSGSGIAGLLSKAPNLKLVFLNGCGTANQVLDLHAFGVKAVLATENPIQDDTAALFAKYFYQSIAQNDTIAEAFRKLAGR